MQGKNELVFELKGLRPTQIPMSRMAEYMKEFAALLGGKDLPMFSEVRQGSTHIAAAMTTIGPTRRRVYEASRGLGPKDAQKAFNTLAQMAMADNSPARVATRAGTIVHFPQRSTFVQPIRVIERGSLTGRMSGVVDERGGRAKARIRPTDGGPLVYAVAEGNLADTLGTYFRKFVRVYGIGEWIKAEGGWICQELAIDEIHAVENVSVLDAFKAIREMDLDWDDNFLESDDDVSQRV